MVIAKAMDASLYDAHSLNQASVHGLAAPMLRAAATAAAEAAVKNGDNFIGVMICGASTGLNDIAAIKKDVLPAMWATAPGLAIRALFQDLPSNDWAKLMLEMAKLDGVSCSATSGDAQEKITTPESIHLVMCFSMLHWIQNMPWGSDQSGLDGAISYVTLGPERKAEARAAADTQLSNFFKSRLVELTPGGQIVAAFDGETQSKTHHFARTYHLLERGLKSMIADNLLPAELLLKYFIPTVPFGEAHIEAILSKGMCGKTVEYTVVDIPCQYLLAYQNDHNAAACGKQVANAIVACIKKQFQDALLACNIDADKSPKLIDELSSRCAKISAADPVQFNTSGVMGLVHLRK